MKRFWGWLLIAFGLMLLLCCTFVGAVVVHLVPLAVAILVLYVGFRNLSAG